MKRFVRVKLYNKVFDGEWSDWYFWRVSMIMVLFNVDEIEYIILKI